MTPPTKAHISQAAYNGLLQTVKEQYPPDDQARLTALLEQRYTVVRNWAEATQHEAYLVAQRKLAKNGQDAALPRLAALHERNLALAAEWSQPKSKLPPLGPDQVMDSTVAGLANALVAEATAE
jgi:hypothetical protein